MGWLWGSGNSSDDAVKDLDPSLKQMLNKGSPSQPGQSRTASSSSQVDRQQPFRNPEPQEHAASAQSPSNNNPPTQFPDGRYAGLWKNYRPLDQLKAESMTEQDRLRDIADHYKIKERWLGEVVQENCVFEQLAQRDCYQNGSLAQRMTLCRAEGQALERCMEMNTKFLKALGFLNVDETDMDRAERIQMHGDKLYRRMIEQEKAAQAARDEGREPPKFPPLMSNANAAAAMGLTMTNEEKAMSPLQREMHRGLHGVTGPARKQYIERIEKMDTPESRELELRLIESEIATSRAKSQELEGFLEREQEGRHTREAAGQSTMGDRVKRWWGWG